MQSDYRSSAYARGSGGPAGLEVRKATWESQFRASAGTASAAAAALGVSAWFRDGELRRREAWNWNPVSQELPTR